MVIEPREETKGNNTGHGLPNSVALQVTSLGLRAVIDRFGWI